MARYPDREAPTLSRLLLSGALPVSIPGSRWQHISLVKFMRRLAVQKPETAGIRGGSPAVVLSAERVIPTNMFFGNIILENES